jgi:hypothetical protein
MEVQYNMLKYDNDLGVDDSNNTASGVDDAGNDDLLSMVRAEFSQSIGMSHDSDLTSSREIALRYYNGDVFDVSVFGQRSKTVSTDIADNIEAVLPDLVDVLSGEDVAVFQPVGIEDEEAAQQETDYINHVFFEQNNGFQILYDGIKEALLLKTGIFRWYWEEDTYLDTKNFDQLDGLGYMTLLDQGYQLTEGVVEEIGEDQILITGAVFSKEITKGQVKVETIPSERFAVGRDTVRLRDAAYCVAQIETRKQDLLDKGYDPEKVNNLTNVDAMDNETIADARDVDTINDNYSNSIGPMQQVTILEHYIRVEGQIKRLITDYDSTTVLSVEDAQYIQYSSICPYPMPHRFYGLSLADKLIEVQRVKTGIQRHMLDELSFSLNQRMEVSEDGANENTISDLLNNTPGAPIRSRNGGAVRPVRLAGSGFDYLSALETANVMAERRTGIMRGETGMKADTLHDTASGALTMLSEGKKRTRLMARIFAEGGIKDMMLGIHCLIKEYATEADYVRLRGKWTQVDPTKWGRRNDMTIEIGVGAGGKRQEAMLAREVINLQAQIVQQQGGAPEGSLATPQSIHAALVRFAEKAGMKAPELYFPAPQEMPEDGPPPPTDAQVKAQADAQAKQQEMELKKYEIDSRMQLEREKLAQADAIERDKLERETALAIEMRKYELQMKEKMSSFRPGGSLIT